MASMPSSPAPPRQSLPGSRPSPHFVIPPLPRAKLPSKQRSLGARAAATSASPGKAVTLNGYSGNGAAAGAGAGGEGGFFVGSETVNSVMTRMVVVATPSTLLGDILEHFAFYTGLPVVEERTHHLVGMITNIDMYKKQRGKAANVANTQVKEVMTSPVVAVYLHTLISFAAGLMLKYRIHRLPVIDHERRVVGIVTNEDLFQTLTASKGPGVESFRMVP